MRAIPLICAAIMVLGGCAYITRKGVYDGSDAVGWTHETGNGGVSIYTLGSHNGPEGFVSFSTSREGSIYVHVCFLPASPRFSGAPVQIICHDLGKRQTVAPQEEMTLDVTGCHDFTVVLPSFTVNEVIFPELTARFRWSDRSVRYYTQLQ
jgi:hypothetical protein